MIGVYRWLSTVGEEVIVLPVGEPFEYNAGDSSTLLVECLVLYSQHAPATEGLLRKFAVVCLKQFVSLEGLV